jgi:hypothetical protein
MKWNKNKTTSDLVQNMMIPKWSFMYLFEQRHNNQEALYKVLDRVLQEHETYSRRNEVS